MTNYLCWPFVESNLKNRTQLCWTILILLLLNYPISAVKKALVPCGISYILLSAWMNFFHSILDVIENENVQQKMVVPFSLFGSQCKLHFYSYISVLGREHNDRSFKDHEHTAVFLALFVLGFHDFLLFSSSS